MKNYFASDFALNKTNEEAIVYRFVDGTIVEIKSDDYPAVTDKMKIDFATMKAWSDDDYEDLDNDNYNQTWKNVSFHRLEETDACCVPSAEFEVIEKPEQSAKKKHRHKVAKQALGVLTKTQRRRYIQHHVNGLSTWEIAELENTNQKSVYESIKAAEKKIKEVIVALKRN